VRTSPLCYALPFSEREKSLPGTSGEVMREYFLSFSWREIFPITLFSEVTYLVSNIK
jgi:hypothetical protein